MGGETAPGRMTVADFDELFEDIKTWGTWGPDDEIGTLNYLTPDRVAAATSVVESGRTVTLSLPVNTVAGPDTPAPALHYMVIVHDIAFGDGDGRFATDFIGIDFHGESQSHVDALNHVSYRGKLYNDRPVELVTSRGSSTHSVDAYRHGIVGRGVMIDIPRLRGVDWLEPGEWVTGEEIEAAEEAQGVRLEEGDVFLFRTGQHRRRLALGAWDNNVVGRAGLHPTALRLLSERRVAVFAADGDGETIPSPVDGVSYPMHPLKITAMGMCAFDNLQFEDLAAACEEEGRDVFLFAAGPLRIGGATGSPINPIAIF